MPQQKLSILNVVFGVTKCLNDMSNRSQLRLVKNEVNPKKPSLSFSAAASQVWPLGCRSFHSVRILHMHCSHKGHAYRLWPDVIKTRLQIYDLHHRPTSESQPLLSQSQQPTRPSSLSIARSAYQNEGATVFFRGIGICSARAFVVNAVQWAVRIVL